ncbi:hypothetical protein [Streptomyces tateyamensis]|uniref:hypothetical protein n=1 Tax=Streptomyces tateyamensis TaxID=565073 RepID=UPI0015E8D7A6|nr:hypothetical protein [Streptomyces tateyamensis]
MEVGEHPEIAAYVAQALTALGVENGPGHSELILTADGPVLIGTGARMHGASTSTGAARWSRSGRRTEAGPRRPPQGER